MADYSRYTHHLCRGLGGILTQLESCIGEPGAICSSLVQDLLNANQRIAVLLARARGESSIPEVTQRASYQQ